MSSATVRQALIAKLQSEYEQNRDASTWGTPQVSPFFFEKWQRDGLVAALLYFREKQKEMGSRWLPASLKVGLNLTGSALISLGLHKKTRQKSMLLPVYASAYAFALFTLALSQGSSSDDGIPYDEEQAAADEGRVTDKQQGAIDSMSDEADRIARSKGYKDFEDYKRHNR